jgi:hypothetical protein
MERQEYANGTYLAVSYPWGLFHGGRAMCPDGIVRTLKRISSTADTFFSIPASVTAYGKTVSGYVTCETVAGFSTETEDDPAVIKFVPYRYRKNWAIVTPLPFPADEGHIHTYRNYL